jgi:nucleoside diphosphate kinase
MMPFTFTLLKPDIFYRNLLPELLSHLEQHQFQIVDFLSGKVTDAHYRLMYSHHFRWDLDDWHHNKKLFDFGPALGLLLYSKQGIDATQFLNQIKGSALPKDRKPDSLRALLQSKSRIFNLLHVPDQMELAQKEAFHWFGSHRENFVSFVSKEDVIAEMQMCGYCRFENLDPEYVFIKSKLRLFHSLKKRTQALELQLHQMQHFYDRWANQVLQNPDCTGIEGTLLPAHQKEEKIRLAQLKQSIPSDQPELSNAISMILEIETHSLNFFWILEEWNVFLCDLEKYLIATRLKH